MNILFAEIQLNIKFIMEKSEDTVFEKILEP